MYKIQELENGNFWIEFLEKGQDDKFIWRFSGEFHLESLEPTAAVKRGGFQVQVTDKE